MIESNEAIYSWKKLKYVFQTMFLSTFNINRNIIQTAIAKRGMEILLLIFWGEKINHDKYDSDALDAVKEHIKKFPVMDTHFLFVEKTPKNNENFNVEFHQQKKDQCDICLEYQKLLIKHNSNKNRTTTKEIKNETRNWNTEIKKLLSNDNRILAAVFNIQNVTCSFRGTLWFLYK